MNNLYSGTESNYNLFQNFSDYEKSYDDDSISEDILQHNREKKDYKLSHKDCVLIYLNPDITTKTKLDYAYDHIKKCKYCKHNISKQQSAKIETFTNIKPQQNDSQNRIENNLEKLMQLLNENSKELIKLQQNNSQSPQMPIYEKQHIDLTILYVICTIIIFLIIIDILLRIIAK